MPLLSWIQSTPQLSPRPWLPRPEGSSWLGNSDGVVVANPVDAALVAKVSSSLRNRGLWKIESGRHLDEPCCWSRCIGNVVVVSTLLLFTAVSFFSWIFLLSPSPSFCTWFGRFSLAISSPWSCDRSRFGRHRQRLRLLLQQYLALHVQVLHVRLVVVVVHDERRWGKKKKWTFYIFLNCFR